MLKKASNKVEILELDGSKVHAVRPNKSDWDEYTSILFERVDGKSKTNSGKAMQEIYRRCIKKLEDVELGVDENGKLATGTLTNSDDIVDFLAQLQNVVEGQKLDGWLLGLAQLDEKESKNSVGESPAESK